MKQLCNFRDDRAYLGVNRALHSQNLLIFFKSKTERSERSSVR